MRKVEQQMLEAVRANKNWKNGNTEVVIRPYSNNGHRPTAAVYLHGNVIAVMRTNGTLVAREDTFAKWPTPTTASRLSAFGFGASIQNGKPYLERVHIDAAEV